MKYLQKSLPVLILLPFIFLSACSVAEESVAESSTNKISTTDSPEVQTEIRVTDADFHAAGTVGANLRRPVESQSGRDFSNIVTMFDGFENKVERRCFTEHPRLNCVVLLTRMNGRKQGEVLGQNGQIIELPQDLINTALTASADQLADAVGIYETRKKIEAAPLNLSPAQLMEKNPPPTASENIKPDAVPTNRDQTEQTAVLPEEPAEKIDLSVVRKNQ